MFLISPLQALELKDEEVDELKGIRERLMKEVSDFTASLFEVRQIYKVSQAHLNRLVSKNRKLSR